MESLTADFFLLLFSSAKNKFFSGRETTYVACDGVLNNYATYRKEGCRANNQ